MLERLQKLISGAGIMSRRAAEKLIEEGKVLLNGEVAELGMKADPLIDDIIVDGVALTSPVERTYIMLNKPKGYVTTLSDEKGRKNVSMLVNNAGMRLYPVGRLDINSEGLLIMTNDGAFANTLMHPSGNIIKTYKTWVSGDNIKDGIEKIQTGTVIDGVAVKPKKVKVIKEDDRFATLLISIGEGKNREVRRICDAAGLMVTRLCRIKEGELELGNLKSGEWRYLTPSEIQSVIGAASE